MRSGDVLVGISEIERDSKRIIELINTSKFSKMVLCIEATQN